MKRAVRRVNQSSLNVSAVATYLDAALFPLLMRLWRRGVRTYQSCSGHDSAESFPAGHIWLEEAALSRERAQKLTGDKGIEQVALLFGREARPVWEVTFAGETLPAFANVTNAILDAVSGHSKDRGE